MDSLDMGRKNVESVNNVVKLFASRGSTTQAVLVHDGTTDTETVINFGATSNRELDLTTDYIEILRNLKSMQVFVEIHLRLAAAAIIEFNIWAEFSMNGGVSWTPYPNSLKIHNFNSKDDGVVLFDFSLETEIPKGLLFRLICTKIGSTDLNIQAPDDLTVGNGTASGYAAKTVVYYNVK